MLREETEMNDEQNSGSGGANRTQIIVAAIGCAGVIVAAYIGVRRWRLKL